MDPEVEALIEALQNGDAARRAASARRLGRLGDQAAVPYLEETLFDPEYRVSEHAMLALGRICARETPELQAALEDADAFVQERAPQALPALMPPAAPVLIQALQEHEGFVLASIIEALIDLGSAVVPALMEALWSSKGFARAAGAEALGRIGDPVAIPALLELLKDKNSLVAERAGVALSRYGTSVTPTLLEALLDKSSRRGAAKALGRIGDPAVTPALLKVLMDADRGLQSECYMAFRRIGPSARPYLLEALQDSYEFTRAGAASALGVIGARADVPVLIEALQDPGRFGRVRSSAADALARIGDKSALPALLAALQDKHEAVRAGAVAALGVFGEREIIPPVIQALADPRLSVRQQALDALGEWDSAAIPALERALLNPAETIRSGAATALLRIYADPDLPRRIMRIPEVLTAEKVIALKALVSAHHPLPDLMVLCRELMGDQDPVARLAAAEALFILSDRARRAVSQKGAGL